MNIFALDTDSYYAAIFHADKHIVKMPLETAQMLCSNIAYVSRIATPYKITHINHPCTIWARQSASNNKWLLNLGLELCAEYSNRYFKKHKCEDVILWASKHLLPIEDKGLTPFALAFKRDEYNPPFIDAPSLEISVSLYQGYYLTSKAHLLTYKNVPIPQFVLENNNPYTLYKKNY